MNGNGNPVKVMQTTEEFPDGFVECQTCCARYCSKEVYFITHRPPYEFRCNCGPQGLYLRWKIEKHLNPAAQVQEPPTLWQRLGRILRKIGGG